MRGRFFRFPLFRPPQASSAASFVSVRIGIQPYLQGKEKHPCEVHAVHAASPICATFPIRYPLVRTLMYFIR